MESLDEYINSQIFIPNRDGIPVLAEVKKRKQTSNREVVREANPNTILDTRIYKLEFPDGAVAEYSIKTISENLFNQATDGRWDSSLFSHIIFLRKDPGMLVLISEGTIISHIGTARNVVTTKGWDVQV